MAGPVAAKVAEKTVTRALPGKAWKKWLSAILSILLLLTASRWLENKLVNDVEGRLKAGLQRLCVAALERGEVTAKYAQWCNPSKALRTKVTEWAKEKYRAARERFKTSKVGEKWAQEAQSAESGSAGDPAAGDPSPPDPALEVSGEGGGTAAAEASGEADAATTAELTGAPERAVLRDAVEALKAGKTAASGIADGASEIEAMQSRWGKLIGTAIKVIFKGAAKVLLKFVPIVGNALLVWDIATFFFGKIKDVVQRKANDFSLSQGPHGYSLDDLHNAWFDPCAAREQTQVLAFQDPGSLANTQMIYETRYPKTSASVWRVDAQDFLQHDVTDTGCVASNPPLLPPDLQAKVDAAGISLGHHVPIQPDWSSRISDAISHDQDLAQSYGAWRTSDALTFGMGTASWQVVAQLPTARPDTLLNLFGGAGGGDTQFMINNFVYPNGQNPFLPDSAPILPYNGPYYADLLDSLSPDLAAWCQPSISPACQHATGAGGAYTDLVYQLEGGDVAAYYALRDQVTKIAALPSLASNDPDHIVGPHAAQRLAAELDSAAAACGCTVPARPQPNSGNPMAIDQNTSDAMMFALTDVLGDFSESGVSTAHGNTGANSGIAGLQPTQLGNNLTAAGISPPEMSTSNEAQYMGAAQAMSTYLQRENGDLILAFGDYVHDNHLPPYNGTWADQAQSASCKDISFLDPTVTQLMANPNDQGAKLALQAMDQAGVTAPCGWTDMWQTEVGSNSSGLGGTGHDVPTATLLAYATSVYAKYLVTTPDPAASVDTTGAGDCQVTAAAAQLASTATWNGAPVNPGHPTQDGIGIVVAPVCGATPAGGYSYDTKNAGECVAWVRYNRNLSWPGNANGAINIQGHPVVSTPTPGALAVWQAGQFGHVAIVIGVSPTYYVVAEQNWLGYGIVDIRKIPLPDPGNPRFIP